MTDQQKFSEFGTAFGKCVAQSGEVFHPATGFTEDLEQHINLMRERERAFCRRVGAIEDIVTVPAEVVDGWKERIIALQGEVMAHGLSLEAVISNSGPCPDPAILYGNPLAVTDTQKMIERLARAARDPSKVVRVDIRVHSGTRTVVEVEVVTP